MKQLMRLWKFVQALTRDDAYEKYCEHHRACHADSAPLDRKAFYLAEQERKWNGVKRCC
jgi:uncharacterized short protein YbdD (DUF466 family)